MRVLVISNTPWANSNSFGDSFSNIFCGIEGLEFANVFLRYGEPENDLVDHYYQITEKMLLENLLDPRKPSGLRMIPGENMAQQLTKTELVGFDYARTHRLQLFFWMRDLIWKIGRWDSEDFKKFLYDFQPDLIFQPLYYSNYINDIVLFVKEYTKAPMLCYVSDDVYTLRQFSWSSLYWIDRLLKRRIIRKVLSQCDILYVISDIQKREYERLFAKPCKILTKGAGFIGEPPLKEEFHTPLRLVFTGNIGSGRWKMLALLGHAIKKINFEGQKMELRIFTDTPITRKIRKNLTIEGAVRLMGRIPAIQVTSIQGDSDVLVHAEGLRYRDGLHVHQSFSTKIVDYLASGRCILALGRMDTASIAHLAANEAALIVTNKKEITHILQHMIREPAILNKIAQKGWQCGKKHHDITSIQQMLWNDLQNEINE